MTEAHAAGMQGKFTDTGAVEIPNVPIKTLPGVSLVLRHSRTGVINRADAHVEGSPTRTALYEKMTGNPLTLSVSICM